MSRLMIRRGALHVVLAVIASAAAARADDPFDIRRIDPETFRAIAVRVPEGQAPPRIDGRLDDEVWSAAPIQGNFVQREPAFGQPATERTEFRILYDDNRLYIGVWAFDSEPDRISASELKRDSNLGKGDQVKIAIDTFHDHRNAFSFFTNPLGAYKDAHSVENARIINYDWNAVWETKTSIDDKGWYSELSIPLSQLRFRTTIGEATWGLNICRVIIRKNEDTYWVPYPREWGMGGFARVSNAGVLTGLENIKARRRFEFMPFAAPRVSRDMAAGTPTDTDAKLGFDLRLGLTNDLTADLTYNTDFAQVEADQEVVNLTRFSLFFPEKRQFFTESMGIFDYGRSGASQGGATAANDPGLLAVFYSRTIGLVDGREVPLTGGGKVTGRVGAYAVGAMNLTTDEGGRANYTAVRVKRNVFAQSSIGAIVLNRDGGRTSWNRTAGVDAGFVLGPHLMMTGMFAKTFSPGVSGRDMAGVGDLIWRTDRFNYGLTYIDIAERFNAEMGFIPRVDMRNTRAKAAWTPRPGWKGVRQLTFGGAVDYFENHGGRVDSRTQLGEFVLTRQDNASLRAAVARDYDFLPAPFPLAGTSLPVGGYDWTTASLSYTSNQSKRVYGNAGVDVGGYYGGDKQTYRASVNFIVGKTLLVEPNYTRNHITLPGRPLYVTNTLSTRVSHSLSPDVFLKGFFQYNDERRTATFNFLFWYVYRPGSDLYVVYDNGWETDVPGPRQVRVRNRSLAVKVTYWVSR
jgi:hypothetical protein